jgi:hypothetical protein
MASGLSLTEVLLPFPGASILRDKNRRHIGKSQPQRRRAPIQHHEVGVAPVHGAPRAAEVHLMAHRPILLQHASQVRAIPLQLHSGYPRF